MEILCIIVVWFREPHMKRILDITGDFYNSSGIHKLQLKIT
jgi:hypothetical protein